MKLSTSYREESDEDSQTEDCKYNDLVIWKINLKNNE